MGLLDEAIREHLELKRRRGADPDEVSRQEAEALGPVRRDAPAEETPAEPEPAPVAQAPVPVSDDDLPEVEWSPPPEAEAAPADEPPALDEGMEHTAEFSAEDVADAVGEPPDDVVPADEEEHDELEETPDFLQETPEHDRLWFEQKPPKDFDF